MRHEIEDYTTNDLIAAINSDFQTDSNKAECIAELLHRMTLEQEGVAEILSQ